MAKMIASLQRLPKSTLELTITLPWTEVEKTYQKLLGEVVKEVELPGFRKGKAPKNLAQDKIDKTKILEKAIQEILPQAYTEALKEHNLHPITLPKISLITTEEEKDWVFKATICEKPQVELGNYQEAIKRVTVKGKIVLPGKEPQVAKLEDIFAVLLEVIPLEIPDLLVETEVNRLLSQTLDEIKTLGLNLEQYLSSSGKTPQILREEYTQKAINDLRIEFILDKIAEGEKIMVTDEDINEAIKKAPDPKTRETLENQRYLLAGVLRRQKTLDFLQKF